MKTLGRKRVNKLVIIYLVILAAIVTACNNTPVYLSYPEEGVTCIELDRIFNTGRVPAGCFTGDVTKSDNKFSEEATRKYQSSLYL